MLIAPREGEPFVFAGLLGRWTDEANDEQPAVTILTTEPNAVMAEIHDRMPVILPSTAWSRWLDPNAGADEVADLLVPCPDDWLTVRPVSRRVNNPANDSPEVLAAAATD